MHLIQLIYISRSRLSEPIEISLAALQENADANNAGQDVTGLLVYSAGNFLQIIEGDDRVIEKLYDKICRDDRHTDVCRLCSHKIERRLFDRWHMGLINLESASTLEKRAFETLVQSCRRAPRTELIRRIYAEFRDQLQGEPAGAMA
jgi:hypothetical protein